MTRLRRGILSVVVVALAFLIGFGWQYRRAEALERELESTRDELVFRTLEATLAAAVISAERGDFEAARTLASDFFTGLQQHITEAPPPAREELDAVLAQRDATITALSRSTPESRDDVARLFSRYRIALGGPEQALPVPAPTAIEPG